jgi:hypothetical protein
MLGHDIMQHKRMLALFGVALVIEKNINFMYKVGFALSFSLTTSKV